MSSNVTAIEKLTALLQRAGKVGAYDDSELSKYQCSICMDFPEDGTYALVGCPNAHDCCSKCVVDLQQRAGGGYRATLKCPECRGVVCRPASGWHPVPAVAKQRLLALEPVSCCIDGCDFKGPITKICTHIESVHAGDFLVTCHLRCGWEGKQCDLAKHMEEVDHMKFLHPFVLETNSKVTTLETELKTERDANAAFRRDMLDMMRAVQTSTVTTRNEVGRIVTELDLGCYRAPGKTALGRLEDVALGLKSNFDAFKARAEPLLEERLTKVAKRVCDLAPDRGFPGGVGQSKMYARKAMRNWWGIPEEATRAGDWTTFEVWVREHLARSAAAGKELRTPHDDGAPPGWKKDDSVATGIDQAWYTVTEEKATRVIEDAMKFSRDIANTGYAFQNPVGGAQNGLADDPANDDD